MSNNFKIERGDLVVGTGRAYERVSGLTKLQQDLQLWLLERIGTDPSTPTYGSSLDGGVIDGKPFPSYIGQLSTQARVNEIEAEVRRVLELYQETQANKMQLEMAQFGKHTLDANEILSSIDNIQSGIVGDTIVVKVTISTAAYNQLTLTIPAQV